MRQLTPIEQRIVWTRFERQSDKDVLMAMARWFCWRADGRQVRFTVKQLVLRSGLRRRTVERALERLEADWWIEVTSRLNRRPTTYAIVLHRLATADPDEVTMVDAVIGRPPEWRSKRPFDRQSGGRTAQWRSKNRPDFEKVADLGSVGAVRTSTSTSPAEEDRHSGGRPEHPGVSAFLEWARVTYPQHANGAQLELDGDRRRHVVHVLLEHYGRTRLEQMAVVCWTIEGDGDPESHATWIARGDRSLYVLKHKAAFLERVVVGAQQLTLGPLMERPLSQKEIDDARLIRTRAYGGCPHEPRCTREVDCVREIALSRRVAAC